MKAGILNYNSIEKRWNVYHKFERKCKKLFLNKMSAGDGFKILKELHQFAYNLKDVSRFKKIDKAKIKALANVHSIFGKVKS